MRIYIYLTIDDWNNQKTKYVLEGHIQKIENGVATIRDNDGNQQYINMDQVFCLVESAS
ncbi:MAG TPA: hypothetical protein VN426_05595 [Syntrophomonadaceae bacterium]|nr:hypothetical protein [Syntrophomonadaceae bacterium]